MVTLRFSVGLFICRLFLGTISMQKSPEWESAGGPHNSFRPIIQMESAIQTGSLQVSFLSLHSPGQVLRQGRNLTFISHSTGQTVIFCHSSTTWKRMSLLFSRNNAKSHKASSVRCSRCYRGGNDDQRKVLSVRDCVVRADHPGSLLAYWRKCQYLYLWESVMCWKLKSLIWQGVAVDRLLNRPNGRSLRDTWPLGNTLLEIQWNDYQETHKCCTETQNDYKERSHKDYIKTQIATKRQNHCKETKARDTSDYKEIQNNYKENTEYFRVTKKLQDRKQYQQEKKEQRNANCQNYEDKIIYKATRQRWKMLTQLQRHKHRQSRHKTATRRCKMTTMMCWKERKMYFLVVFCHLFQFFLL